MRVVAFDPGVAVAGAVYAGPESAPILFPKMGIERKQDGKTRVDPDVPRILASLRDCGPDLVVVEDVGVMPRQGIASSGRFLHAKGLLEGIVYGSGVRLVLVRPQVWRKAFRMPAGKEVSRDVCNKIFPYLSASFARVNSHDVADALLMAVWGWSQANNVPVPI